MPKSSTKRKNGRTKKYVQRSANGDPINKRSTTMINTIRRKQMVRTQLLHQACLSLTSAEVQMAIDSGAGHEMSYVTTKLDDNGVPVDGETKTITLSKVDLTRLESIHRYKVKSEELMKKNAETKE